MAYEEHLLEDEEEQYLLDDTEGYLLEDDTESYLLPDDDAGFTGESAWGTGSTMTPFESSVERMQESAGAAIGEHIPALFPGLVPESWQKTGKEWQADAMKALEGYVPKTEADITKEEWSDVIPNIAEKLQEQGAQNLTQLGGATIGGRMVGSPIPAIRGLGLVVLGGTALTSVPPTLNEVMTEHARILGKNTQDMTPEEIEDYQLKQEGKI